jgi:hypothetical protein
VVDCTNARLQPILVAIVTTSASRPSTELACAIIPAEITMYSPSQPETPDVSEKGTATDQNPSFPSDLGEHILTRIGNGAATFCQCTEEQEFNQRALRAGSDVLQLGERPQRPH